jgi:3-oxoacyl-[acyl-carrier protein] reductase
MIGLTKALVKELFAYNIQVNAVAPGYLDTDMTAKLSEEQKQNILNTSNKKPAKPDKVADFVALLVSDITDLITGQAFIVEATKLKKKEIKYFQTKI